MKLSIKIGFFTLSVQVPVTAIIAVTVAVTTANILEYLN